jgi:hypothetical protein
MSDHADYLAYVKSMNARGLWRNIVKERNFDRASLRGKYATTVRPGPRSYRYAIWQKRKANSTT